LKKNEHQRRDSVQTHEQDNPTELQKNELEGEKTRKNWGNIGGNSTFQPSFLQLTIPLSTYNCTFQPTLLQLTSLTFLNFHFKRALFCTHGFTGGKEVEVGAIMY